MNPLRTTVLSLATLLIAGPALAQEAEFEPPDMPTWTLPCKGAVAIHGEAGYQCRGDQWFWVDWVVHACPPSGETHYQEAAVATGIECEGGLPPVAELHVAGGSAWVCVDGLMSLVHWDKYEAIDGRGTRYALNIVPSDKPCEPVVVPCPGAELVLELFRVGCVEGYETLIVLQKWYCPEEDAFVTLRRDIPSTVLCEGEDYDDSWFDRLVNMHNVRRRLQRLLGPLFGDTEDPVEIESALTLP